MVLSGCNKIPNTSEKSDSLFNTVTHSTLEDHTVEEMEKNYSEGAERAETRSVEAV